MIAIQHCNALDLESDALIYSTNVLLNCTGGMGADLVDRYGLGFQEELHRVLTERGTRFAEQGEVIDLAPNGVPYKKILLRKLKVAQALACIPSSYPTLLAAKFR